MKSQKSKDIVILLFLILGTILAFYIACEGWMDVYSLWNYPDGVFAYGFDMLAIYLDITLSGVAGLVCLCSFLRKGRLWVPLIKCIIVNIILLLVLVFAASLSMLIDGLFVGFAGLIFIAACLFGLWKLWKLADSYKQMNS